jgi:tRNA (guanosine-2'-O-)-methyltransferase
MNNSPDNVAYLSSLVSEHKRALIDQVLRNRTKFVTAVLENISQPHNANAVIRTCDIFGVQDIYAIESGEQFKIHNTISKGATKWVDVHRFKDTRSCLMQLKKRGYTLVATTPHEKGKSLADFELLQKTAFIFGTEVTGISDEAIAMADEFVTIPMFGFTESFNISVAVGIILHQMISNMHHSELQWHLSAKEQEDLKRTWLQKILHIKS